MRCTRSAALFVINEALLKRIPVISTLGSFGMPLRRLGFGWRFPHQSRMSRAFSVEPKRWIVERTLGWLGGWRRLSKECERLAETRAAMIQPASLRLALSRP